jgi:pimeloyl-ACP methyl ester carboxylesterase
MSDGLLLIHAFPMDARMWSAEASGDRTVAPHMPGFGGSGPAGEVMTMSAAATRCVEAVDGAGLDRVVVCGLSMGGYVAFELWRSARERIAGLVLANTKAEADLPDAAENRRRLGARLRAEGNDFLVADPPPLLSDEAPEELWAGVRRTIADQPADAIAAAALGLADRPDSTSDLATIDVPTLVITSAGDRLIPPAVTAAIADHVPGAELATIDGAGHLSNVERPDEFGRLLAAHLVRCGVEA